LAAALLAFSPALRAEDKARPAPPAGAATAPHPLSQPMFQNGAMNCAATAHQLASLLSAPKESTLLQLSPGNPDAGLAVATLVQNRQPGSNMIVTMTLAPNQASGCGASYQRVLLAEQNCQTVQGKYNGIKTQSLGDTGATLGMVNKMQVIFMPAQGKCLIVEQELVK
jgi:hypothetical protein